MAAKKSHTMGTHFRLILLGLLIATGLSAFSRSISPEEAQAVANQFFGNNTAINLPVTKQVKSLNKESDTAPFYIFNNADNQGFVIVSGDDRACRILGYSDKGSFNTEEMPPQLADLLDQYAAQISELPASAIADSSWNSPLRAQSESGGVLLETANWGQGAPYNSLTPEFDGVNAPTGCVATAMAIVMKYHNWPKNGYGVHQYYCSSNQQLIYRDFCETHFEWDEMPMNFNTEVNQCASEVSKLMYMAGIAVDMEYAPFESDAFMGFVGHALRYNFRYSPKCEYLKKSNYTEEVWLDKITNELYNNRPVIYQGSGNGNHAFICDGIDLSGLFHINWGWDGIANGYFALSALCAEGWDFSNDQSMVLGISPDLSDDIYSSAYVDYGYAWNEQGIAPGSHISVEKVEKDIPFDYACRILSVPNGFSGKIGLALVDKDNSIKQVIKDFTYNYPNKWVQQQEVTFLNCKVSGVDVVPTDRIQLVSYELREGEWRIVLGTSEAPSFVPVAGNIPEVATVFMDSDYGSVALDWFTTFLTEKENKVVVGSCLYFDGNSDKDVATIMKDGELYATIFPNENGVLCDYRLIVQPGEYHIDIRKIIPRKFILDVKEPGTLHELMDIHDAHSADELILSGNINARDLWYVRDNCGFITSLDLSDANICSCVAKDSKVKSIEAVTEQKEGFIPAWGLSQMLKLRNVYLPSGLKGIGENAFCGDALRRVDIPESVGFLGIDAFAWNNELSEVAVHWHQPFNCDELFSYTICYGGPGILYVPVGTKNAYLNHDIWSHFNSIVETDDVDLREYNIALNGITYRLSAMGKSAEIVEYDSQFPDIIIPETIEFEGDTFTVNALSPSVFFYKDGLETIVLPQTITELPRMSFIGCINLRKVILPSTLKVIRDNCFCVCHALEEIDLPESLEYIRYQAFEGCESLKRLFIPKNLLLEENAFNNMNSLQEIVVDAENPYYVVENNILYTKDKTTLVLAPGQIQNPINIPEGVERIGGGSLCGLQYVEEINFPKTINYMGYRSIEHNPLLVHVTIPDRVKGTDNEFITYCPNLKSITIGEDLESGNGIHFNAIETVYLRNIKKLDVPTLFEKEYDFTFYSSSITANAGMDTCRKFYVPGKTKENHNTVGANVAEMWHYALNRPSGAIAVTPVIKGIVIDKVIINGEEIEPENMTIYRYKVERSSDLDVVVDFTLHGRQAMTTRYTPEFNATLPDESLMVGIDGISISEEDIRVNIADGVISISGVADNAMVMVYDAVGRLIYHGAEHRIEIGAQGIMFVKVGNNTFKVAN